MNSKIKAYEYLLIFAFLAVVAFVPENLYSLMTGQSISTETAWTVWYQLLTDLSWLGNGFEAILKSITYLIAPLVVGGLLAWGYFYTLSVRKKKLIEEKTRAEFAPVSSLKGWLGFPGLQLTKNIRVFCKRCAEHLLILGPTGSGKSAAFFIPNLVSTDEESSIVVTDPKGELYQKTKKYLEKLGKKVLLFKPDKADVSLCWNPLALPQTPSDIEKTCNSIVANSSSDDKEGGGQDPFWEESAKDLLSGYVYIVKALSTLNEEIPRIEEIRRALEAKGVLDEKLSKYIKTVVSFVDTAPGCEYYKENGTGRAVCKKNSKAEKIVYCTQIKDCPMKRDKYANFANIHAMLSGMSFEAAIGLSYLASALTGYDEPYMKMKAFDAEQNPIDTRNSTKTVLTVSLKAFTDKAVKKVTSANQIFFGELKEKPVALFVSVPEHKSQVFQPIMSTFYMQAIDFLLEKGAGGRYVYFLLDEFANIGKIIGFEKYVATVRSRNISIACGLQSIEQLTRVYGDAQKKEILNNLKIKLIFPGLSEAEALEYLNKIAGQTAIYTKRSLRAEGGEVVDKDVLPIRAIRELKEDYKNNVFEAIVFIGNEKPVKDRQERYYLNKKYLKRTLDEASFPEMDLSFTSDYIFKLEHLNVLELAGIYLYTQGGKKMPNQEVADQVNPKKIEVTKLLGQGKNDPYDWVEQLIKKEAELLLELVRLKKAISLKSKEDSKENRLELEKLQASLKTCQKSLAILRLVRPAIFWCFDKGVYR